MTQFLFSKTVQIKTIAFIIIDVLVEKQIFKVALIGT